MRRRPPPEPNLPPIDLTPMIDCVFLLLVFFILTMRFSPDDLQIAALLSQRGGGQGMGMPAPTPTTVLAILPDGLPINASRDACARRLAALNAGSAPLVSLRLGGSEPLVIDPRRLSGALADQRAAVDAIHAWIGLRLAEREDAGAPRAAAPPIEIRCFSGLPWKVAMAAYDGIRAFELAAGAPTPAQPRDLADARSVTFTTPPPRAWAADAGARELEELARVR
jgi:hypothetical protein